MPVLTVRARATALALLLCAVLLVARLPCSWSGRLTGT